MSGRKYAHQGYKGRRKKRDANELEIVQGLEAHPDVTVVPLDKPVDLLVGYAGRTFLIEVKNPDGKDKLEPDQVEFLEWWRGAPVSVVRTLDEAKRAIGLGASSLSLARISR